MKFNPRRAFQALKVATATAAALLLVGPFLWVSVTGAACYEWSQRGDYHEVPLSSSQVFAVMGDEHLVGVPILPAKSEGLAIPVVGVTLVVGEPTKMLLAHEATHHLQAEHDGNIEFAGRYAFEFVRGLYSGCGAYDAYRSVGYEIQARRLSVQAVYRHGNGVGDARGNLLISTIASAVTSPPR